MMADALARKAILFIAFVATTALIYQLSIPFISPSPHRDDVGVDPESENDGPGFGIGAVVWRGGIEKFKGVFPHVSEQMDGPPAEDEGEEIARDVERTHEEADEEGVADEEDDSRALAEGTQETEMEGTSQSTSGPGAFPRRHRRRYWSHKARTQS